MASRLLPAIAVLAASVVSLSSCGKATVILQNETLQKALGNVFTNVAVRVIEKAVDAISGTAHAGPLPQAQSASRPDLTPVSDPEREAVIARLSRLELEFAMREQAAMNVADNGTVTYTCQAGETQVECVERLQVALSRTVEGRAAALQFAFVQCRDQAASASVGGLVSSSDAISSCVSGRGFRDEVLALDPGFAQRSRG